MYPVSQAFRETVLSNNRTFALKIHIDTAFESFDLTDEDISLGALKVTEGAVSGNTFSLGAAVVADLSMTLLNTGGRFDEVQFNGGKLVAQVGLEVAENEFEYVPLGVFNIDDVSRPTSVVTISAANNLLLLDKPFADVGLSFPATHLQILTFICQYCGVPLGSTNFLNAGHSVLEAPSGTPSCRDIVASIAALAAGWAYCDRQGYLQIGHWQGGGCVSEVMLDGNTDNADGGDFSWYNNKPFDGGVFDAPSSVVTLGPENRYDLSVDDDPITITGLIYEADKQTYTIGSDAYALRISDNPLLQEDPAELLQSVADVMIGFAYLPYTSNWQGDPALECGDIIRHVARNGQTYNTIVTDSTWVYRGKSTIKARGASQITQGYQSQSDKKITKLERRIYQKQQQLDAMDLAVKNATALMAAALGGHVIQGTGQYEGNIFIADTEDIHTAKKIWRWNLGGFAYYDNGLAGGITSTAITADGSIFAQLITANMMQTGVLRSTAQTATGVPVSQLDLDTGVIQTLTTDGQIRTIQSGSGGFRIQKLVGGAWADLFFVGTADGKLTVRSATDSGTRVELGSENALQVYRGGALVGGVDSDGNSIATRVYSPGYKRNYMVAGTFTGGYRGMQLWADNGTTSDLFFNVVENGDGGFSIESFGNTIQLIFAAPSSSSPYIYARVWNGSSWNANMIVG